MGSVSDLINLHQYKYGPRDVPESTFSQLAAQAHFDELKRQKEEKLKQQNYERELDRFQKLQQMEEGTQDLSSSGKAAGIIDSKTKQQQTGIVKAQPRTSGMEYSFKDGVLSTEYKSRPITPQEQNAMFEMNVAQAEQKKQEMKVEVLDAFVSGATDERELLSKAQLLGITKDEYIFARQKRDLMRQAGGTPIPSGYDAKEMAYDEMIGAYRPQSVQRTPIPTEQELVTLQRDKAALARETNPTPVDVSNVPPGYRISGYEPDEFGNMVPKGYERIPETSKADQRADQEMSDAQRAKDNQSEMVMASAQDTLDTIAEVRKGINQFGALGPIPTINPLDYNRKEWEANINKLLSTKIVNLMNEMKQASKTGATGFGQLNKSELQLLQNASTALNRGLSPEQADKYLAQMEAMANKIIARQNPGEGGGPASSGSFVEGKVYRDAQGNRAVFRGGQWEDVSGEGGR